jgi:hypothetical protein
MKRKRTGEELERKTVYFIPTTAERLDRYAFENRLKLWEVVEAAVLEYLDRNAPVTSRRRTSMPPSQSSPPSTRKSTIPPRSKRFSP